MTIYIFKLVYTLRNLKRMFPDILNSKGFKTILDCAISGTLKELVVTYKDRLCRFGFELIRLLFARFSNTKFIFACENNTTISPEEDICRDILSILTVFTAQIHGKRSYGKRKNAKKKLQNEENANIL